MNGPLYVQILERALLPFYRKYSPMKAIGSIGSCRIMILNTPQKWNADSWKKMGLISQRLLLNSRFQNPIENLWYELKEYILWVVKPKKNLFRVLSQCE